MNFHTVIPTLSIVIPCFNEDAVLPITAPLVRNVVDGLIRRGKISQSSFILFADDGSTDGTWGVICNLHSSDKMYRGIRLSRNRGHQNALLAGLLSAKDRADAVVSVDCDGQDDFAAIEKMIDEFLSGNDIVYGCRSRRDTDTWFKRTTAVWFYRVVACLGGEIVFNHADYRLASSRVLEALSEYHEVNLFLRGLFPMLGFKSTKVFYERKERKSGESHYPLLKMTSFALDGITSLSIRPIRLITSFGCLISMFAIVMGVWALYSYVRGDVVPGWTSSVLCTAMFAGIQLLSIGVIGEYVGKIYLESKHRPRYVISESTFDE